MYAAQIKVGGFTKVVQVTKVRPADAFTYAIGDVVNESVSAGTVWTFPNCARVTGGSGRIVGANLVFNTAPSVKFMGELWVYHTAPASANDNVAFAPTILEQRNLIGVLSFGLPYVGGANVFYEADLAEKPFVTVGSASLFGILVARNLYIPAASEEITAKLLISQD